MYEIKIEFTKSFLKDYRASSMKIQKAFDERLKIFKADRFSDVLNNHSLEGAYMGFRSINITGDWRALYTLEARGEKTTCIFRMMGTHSKLYK